MLIQILLTLALIGYGAYAQFQRRVSHIVSNLSTLACGAGFILVWNPGLSNDLARLVGVGRGADLLFYVFIAVSGFIGLYLHLRVDVNMQMVTELARAIALQAPLRPDDPAARGTDVRPAVTALKE
jgi:small membrane protein